MVPRLLLLALEFHREPLCFSHLTDPTQPLPDDFSNLLREATKALAPGRIQETAAALDTRPDVLHKAFLFFLRQTLLFPGANHYRVLGLSRDASEASIKQHHSLLVRMFHPDRVPTEVDRNSMLAARINSAYQILRDPRSRRTYEMSLPPLPVCTHSRIHSPAHFQPSVPARESRKLARRKLFPYYLRWAVKWLLAASAFVAVVFWALEDEQPMLRVDPNPAMKPAPHPILSKIGKPRHAQIGKGNQSGGEITEKRVTSKPEMAGQRYLEGGIRE